MMYSRLVQVPACCVSHQFSMFAPFPHFFPHLCPPQPLFFSHAAILPICLSGPSVKGEDRRECERERERGKSIYSQMQSKPK